VTGGWTAETVSVTAGDAITPSVATMDVDPGLAAVASPCEALMLLTEATAALEELQVTDVVRFCVDLSL
jgi:hypothetical protein